MKKRILLGFGLLLFIFLMGSVIAAMYITKTTHRMDKLILLHQVEILREDLIIRVQQVQSSLSHSKLPALPSQYRLKNIVHDRAHRTVPSIVELSGAG